MWEIMDDYTACDECAQAYVLPPPMFELPPPPMPPHLQNFVKCNDDDILMKMKNWDTDMCAAIPTFEESILSSPMAQALTLVGVFSTILLLVIIFSVIYVKRLMNQKNDGCKELKNLMKHTLHRPDQICDGSGQRGFLEQVKTQNENMYAECDGAIRYNQYTTRQAHDFISYVPRNNVIAPSRMYCTAQQRNISSISAVESGYVEPLRHLPTNYMYMGLTSPSRHYSDICTGNYMQMPSYITPMRLKHSQNLSPCCLERELIIHSPSKTRHLHDLYSTPYEDIDDLPGYSRSDTGYGGSSEDGGAQTELNLNDQHSDTNTSNSCISINRCGQIGSVYDNHEYIDPMTVTNVNTDYTEIDVVLPNLVLQNGK